jgi:murein DD-endopeptidase MepM/ murein hydrolase activator NlpD
MGRDVRVRWGRRAVALVLAVAAFAGGTAPVAAVTDGEISSAREKLVAARAEARRAALAYLRAEHDLADVEVELAEIEAEIPILRAKVERAHRALSVNALNLYTGSTTGGTVAGGLFGADDAMDVGRVTMLAGASTETASEILDRLRANERALEAKERDARERRVAQEKLRDAMREESSKLGDAMRAAGKALRKLQAQQAVQQYWEAVARQEAARKAAEAAKPKDAPPSTPGRRSGPADPDLASTIPVEDLLCPIQAPVTFFNDWGQPRSNWRVHEGTDVFAERGTPNVAIADGVAIRRQGGLGGNAIRLETNDGHSYYYAHFERFERGFNANGRRRVKQGDVIGYTGNTGNAAGGPVHTHFEVHPGKGAPINPYPFLKDMCAAQLGEEDGTGG